MPAEFTPANNGLPLCMDLIKKFYGGADESSDENEVDSDGENVAAFDLSDAVQHERLSCRREAVNLRMAAISNPPETGSSGFQFESDGSFFDDGGDGTESVGKKRAKRGNRMQKEIQKQNTKHGIKLVDCGCQKECTTLVRKDDRLAVHREFQELNAAD